MARRHTTTMPAQSGSEQTIGYVRQMLGELRAVAEKEDQPMLAYLIEMAYLEAGDAMAAAGRG